MLNQVIASVSRSERLNFRQARTACKVLRQLKEIRSDFSGKEIETGKKNENQQKRLPIGCRIELQTHDHTQMLVPLYQRTEFIMRRSSDNFLILLFYFLPELVGIYQSEYRKLYFGRQFGVCEQLLSISTR